MFLFVSLAPLWRRVFVVKILSVNRFLDAHKDNWQRLENLLDMMKLTGIRGLSRMEVREFGDLYRRAAAKA